MKNKYNIPVYKNISIFDLPMNCIDHYDTFDGSINYRRTLNRYRNIGNFIRKKYNNVQK